MKSTSLLAGAALAATAAFGLAGAASAAAPAAHDTHSCFFARDWDSWHSPDANTIYLRVGVRDIYRVDLSAGSQRLTWPDAHIISRQRGPSTVCSPLDLDLAVSDSSGFPSPLIAKAITHLTPDEVAAIPKKDLP